jgi:hypothetical protein
VRRREEKRKKGRYRKGHNYVRNAIMYVRIRAVLKFRKLSKSRHFSSSESLKDLIRLDYWNLSTI